MSRNKKEKFNFINDMCNMAYEMQKDVERLFVTNIIEKTFDRLDKYDKAKDLIKKKKVDVIHILNISKAYVKELWLLVYNENHANELTQEEFDLIVEVLD